MVRTSDRSGANSSPLVSVVVASYNQSQFIQETIDSILNQDYPALELIVVDDGSTDGTAEILQGYASDRRVKVIYQENSGQTVAKNRGCKEASGKYIAFCDSDDYWLPGKLTDQVACAEADGNIAVVYGESAWINERGETIPRYRTPRHSGRITAQLLFENFVTFPTVMVRRDVFEEVGGFDEQLTMSIDYDLWLRISVGHDFLYVPKDYACYRIWGGQMSRRMDERLENAIKLLERFHQDNPRAVSWLVKRKAEAYTYVTRALWRARNRRWREAWSDYWQAARIYPASKRLLKGVVNLALRRV